MPPSPGYPESTSRLVISLPGPFEKHCHASLVHPQWAITAAHCFSDASASGRSRLTDFDRNFSLSDVRFHPGAHESGSTRRQDTWVAADFHAAHDLALIPFEPALSDVQPLALVHSTERCADLDSAPTRGHLGQLDAAGLPSTQEVELLGLRQARELLGEGQEGQLLAARGARISPGDSGSGLSVDGDALDDGQACLAYPDSDATATPALLGVLQNAAPGSSDRPFGVVPTYTLEHARWIASTLSDEPPPAPPEPPRLEP